jgi:hypothetical protein
MTKKREELLAPPAPSVRDELSAFWNIAKRAYKDELSAMWNIAISGYKDASLRTKYFAGLSVAAAASTGGTTLAGAYAFGDAMRTMQDNILNGAAPAVGTSADFGQAAVYFGATLATYYAQQYSALATQISLDNDRIEKTAQTFSAAAPEL